MEKFFPGRGDTENLCGPGEEKQVNTSTGTIFMAKTKKTLFHIIPLGISDHNLIGCIRKINSRKYKRKTINTRNYRAYNKEEMLSDLGRVDWDLLYKQDNVNTTWKFISNNLRKIFEKFLRSIHQKLKKE